MIYKYTGSIHAKLYERIEEILFTYFSPVTEKYCLFSITKYDIILCWK
jgi:hypothetical protein